MTTSDIERQKSVLRGDTERELDKTRREYEKWGNQICKDCGSPMGWPVHQRCSGIAVTGYRWNPQLKRAMRERKA